MRLVRKISFKDIKKLDYFQKITEKFEKVKDTKPDSKIGKTKDISDLNFYLLIEFEDILDKLDYFNNFFNDEPFQINDFKEQHDKLIKYIKGINKKSNRPDYFKKLGNTNEVKGCYLVASIKENKDNITPFNSSSNLCIRLSFKNLPEQIEEMCNEFHEFRQETAQRERDEFNKMIGMTLDEQERLINSLLQNIHFPSSGMSQPIFSMLGTANPFLQPLIDGDIINNKIRIEDAIENHLDEIEDVAFLEDLMESAIEDENYELCAKLRDRIRAINGHSEETSK